MFQLGRDCLCNREAPTLGRFTCPLCWRCTGIAAGMAALATVDCLGGLADFPPLVLAAAGVSCGLPAATDVFCQMACSYRSTRRRRMATGLLLGTGVVFLAHTLVPLLHGLF